MKTIRVTIDGELLLMRQCDDSVTVGDILQRTTRVLDKLKVVKEANKIPVQADYFSKFIKELAREHGTTKEAILGKRRDGALPAIRAIAASAWMQVTNTPICRTAEMVGFTHASCRTGLDRLSERERQNRELKKQHRDAITLCRFICMKGVEV